MAVDLVDRKPILLDKVSFLVTRLLSVRPMYFSSLASALPVSRKKLTRVVKGLISKGAFIASSDRREGDENLRKRGRPKVWLSLTESGFDLFRRQLSVMLSHLNVLFGDDYLAGPWLSYETYKLRFAAPSIDIIVKRKDLVSDPLVIRDLRGIVDRYYVWAGDNDPFWRGRRFTFGKVEASALAVEDLVVFTLRYNKVPNLVIAVPVVLSAAGREVDYAYLHRKAAEYGILQEVGFLLDIACYLDPELQERGGVTLFARDKAGFKTKNLLVRQTKMPSLDKSTQVTTRVKDRETQEVIGEDNDIVKDDASIIPYRWFWKITQTPTLDEFLEVFLTYSPEVKTRRLLDRLYDEGHWLLTKEVNSDLFGEYVER
nr:hypothetical protein [Candidatus Njordarchaeum guaymaensis]